MDELKALRYFTAVADTGSFTAAAKRFSVPASSISRRISDLEKSLSAELIQRTTRNVSLTEVGHQYYQRIQPILQQLAVANLSVKDYQEEPQGVLKINSTVGFGERLLLPVIDEFSERYPLVSFDIVLSDELSKLSSGDVDIAIRGGFAPDERVVAIQLMENNFLPVASASYLKRFGQPSSTRELPKHKGLYFKTPLGPTPWLSEIDGQWQNISAPAVAISNNGKWLVQKAIEGKGLLMMPRWVLQDSLDSGELQQLTFPEPLNITQQQDLAIYLLYQKQRYRIPKVKAAIDYITARLKTDKA